jgi:hypothetical protein
MVNAKEFWMKEGEKKGVKIGEKKGIQLGIDGMVMGLLKKNFSLEEVIELLQEQFKLSRREAMRQAKKAMA